MDRQESSSSSDEDEDLQTLISQPQSKPQSDPPSRSPLTKSPRNFSARKKHYLLTISLVVVLLLLLYFSLPFGRRLFSGVSDVRTHYSPSDLLRESELKALFLLRNLQSSLLNIFNKTLVGSNGSSLVEEFRLAVLEQIKLNSQIQKALLSAHRPKNSIVRRCRRQCGF